MSDNYVHIAFRSKETGRYLFHVRWPKDDFARFEHAAELEGKTLDEFIEDALKRAVVDKGVGIVENTS